MFCKRRLMKRYKNRYSGVFNGTRFKNLRINRYSIEEIIKALLETIPLDEEGTLQIHEIDIKTNERKLCKNIFVINDLFLTEQEVAPYYILK